MTLNPTQVQLLRQQAARLQIQIRELSSDLRDHNPATQANGLNRLLTDRVRSEVKALAETESRFRELSSTISESTASEAFFSDLNANYAEVLSGLERGAANSGAIKAGHGALLVPSAYDKSSIGSTLPLAALAVIRAFEENELAFSIVANTGSLTFDLSVSSIPQGATISYRRRGDQYKISPTPTNSVIKSLPRAIWQIRFQVDGYIEKEVEYDSIRESDQSLTVELKRK